MSERVRVLHVITGLNLGGAESWLLRLLGALSRGAWAGRLEHRVVTLLPDGVLSGPVRALGVPVQSLGMARGVPGLGAVWRLAGIMGQWRPAVVQTWLYHADLLGWASRALLTGPKPALSWGIRCAYMDFSRYGLGTRLTVRACAALSGRVPAVVANSRAGAEHHVRALGYSAATMRVIENGVDAARFRPDAAAREALRAEWGAGADEVLVGLVARVDPMKGHALFCRMAQLLRTQPVGAQPVGAQSVQAGRANMRFVFCGLGTREGEPGWPELQALLEGHELAGASIRLGQRADVERVLAALDVAVLPSLGEGFPNALAEAVSCGVPAVALDVGDAGAILGPGGVLAPASGDPEARALALAEGVGSLAEAGPEERARLGALGRAHVAERYSLAGAAERWATHFLALSDLPITK